MLLLLATLGRADCSPSPSLRNDDEALVVLSQNVKFIATGGQKAARANILARRLEADPELDLLLLSEARQIKALQDALPEWCLYRQDGPAHSYHWREADGRSSPGGLVLGVRRRAEGRTWPLEGTAGAAFRSRPVSFAEGVLGRLVGFIKGWASVEVAGLRLLWTHTQASYDQRPERGAGRFGTDGVPGVGRAGQLGELAKILENEPRPALLTGDLNLQDGVTGTAGEVDRASVEMLAEGGIRLRRDCPTWLGSLRSNQKMTHPLGGAALDRVGTNPAMDAHPVEVRCEEWSEGKLRLSDHRGLRIRVDLSDNSG